MGRDEELLKQEMFLLLETLNGHENGVWGKMNAWQMVEHLTAFLDVSNGNLLLPVITSNEDLPGFKNFIYSNKEFRENTKAPTTVVPETPQPVTTFSYMDAVDRLRTSVAQFFEYFEKNSSAKTSHPVFGPLTQEEWMLLHGKHARHHLRQFNLIPK